MVKLTKQKQFLFIGFVYDFCNNKYENNSNHDALTLANVIVAG